MARTIILHYHLFKNAGTSLDQILKRNFGSRWVTREFPMAGDDNSAQLAEWIRSEPEAVAFSTHTGIGPVPEVEGVDIVSVMLLRDPVARIRSAYRFERNQEAETWGAQLAKAHDLQGYVEARLARPGDRQCRNFQTHRLAAVVPGDAPELDRARQALSRLSVVGLVEEFDTFMADLAGRIRPAHPDFSWKSVKANTSSAAPGTETGDGLDALLAPANADDQAIWESVTQSVRARLDAG